MYSVQLGKVALDATLGSLDIEDDSLSETLIIDDIIMHPLYDMTKDSGPPHPDVALIKIYSSARRS